jgi:hypothetical protein
MANEPIPFETIKAESAVLMKAINKPVESMKEGASYFTIDNINTFAMAVTSISDIVGTDPEKERDLLPFNALKKELYQTAGKNIAAVMNYFNPKFLKDRAAADFVDKSEDHETMSATAAELIELLLPVYRAEPLLATVNSSFLSIRSIALRIYKQMRDDDTVDSLPQELVSIIRNELRARKQ